MTSDTPGAQPLVIAEVANSHEGDVSRLHATIDLLVENKISVAKFQVLKATELYEESHDRFALFKSLEFDDAIWRDSFSRLKENLIEPYADIFSEETAHFCVEAGLRNLKVHASDAFNRPLIEALSALDLERLIVGVGGLYPFEIADIVDQVKSRSSAEIILMQGQQGYPTSREDNNVEKVAWLVQQFGTVATIGYADHSPGYSDDARELCDLAMISGAAAIEKHVTLDVMAKGIDHESAINIGDLPNFIDREPGQPSALPETRFQLGEGELNYRKSVIKRPVLSGSGAVLFQRELEKPAAVPRGINLESLASRDVFSQGVYRRVAAMIIVRLASNRLKRKALAPLGKKSVLECLIDNLRDLELFEDIVIATSIDPGDDELETFGIDKGIPVFRGSPDNPAERIVGALDWLEEDGGRPVTHFARMTGDNPFPVMELHRKIRETLMAHDDDYIRAESAPLGLNTEYFNAAFFRYFNRAIKEGDRTEYLTYFVDKQRDQIATRRLPIDGLGELQGRYSVDYAEDRAFCEGYVEFAGTAGMPPLSVSTFRAWEKSLESPPSFLPPIKSPQGTSYLVNWGKSLLY